MNGIVTIALPVILSGVTSVLVAFLTTNFKLKREYKLEKVKKNELHNYNKDIILQYTRISFYKQFQLGLSTQNFFA